MTTATSILTAIFAVFSAIGEWMVGMFIPLQAIFWNAEIGALTFLGVLGVTGLGFSVIFLLIAVIQKFLHFRG